MIQNPMQYTLQDTVTGFILAGIGHRTAKNSNFLIVNQDTKVQQVEEAFKSLSTRDDIGIILINQHIANDIRHVLKDYNETIPTVLEIPSKEHPYDPEQDYIMVRQISMRINPQYLTMFGSSLTATSQYVLGSSHVANPAVLNLQVSSTQERRSLPFHLTVEPEKLVSLPQTSQTTA
jgi:V-type H+-transporting ATPase subunit F